MPLGFTEIMLRRSGIRIGYDLVRAKHAVVLDAYMVKLEAKPMEESSGGELLTIHVRFQGRPQRIDMNDATIIFLVSGPQMLEEIQKNVNPAMSLAAPKTIELEPGHVKCVMEHGVVMTVNPHTLYVEYTIGSKVKKAEHLIVEAYKPTLINTLLDARLQTASLLYLIPVEIDIVERGCETRVVVRPLQRLGSSATSQ